MLTFEELSMLKPVMTSAKEGVKPEAQFWEDLYQLFKARLVQELNLATVEER